MGPRLIVGENYAIIILNMGEFGIWLLSRKYMEETYENRRNPECYGRKTGGF